MLDLSLKKILSNWFFWLQLFLSLLILGILIAACNQEQLVATLRNSEVGWVLLALACKSITLIIREFRLWLALNPPRPSLWLTMLVGFVSGGLHTILPGRAGDLAAIALLRKQCKLPLSEATYAVGMAAFFEAAVFGVMLLSALVIHADQWYVRLVELYDQWYGQVVSGLADMRYIIIAGLIIVSIFATLLIGRLRKEPVENSGFTLRSFVQDTLTQALTSLRSLSYLVLNLLFAILEVYLMVLAFRFGFDALGLTIQHPWTACALILAISTIASVAFPATYGVGPAAASIFILATLGISETTAIAYSAIWWLVSQLPAVAFGVPSMWLLKTPSEDQTRVA